MDSRGRKMNLLEIQTNEKGTKEEKDSRRWKDLAAFMMAPIYIGKDKKMACLARHDQHMKGVKKTT